MTGRASPAGAVLGIALLVCAAAVLVLYVSPPIALRGGFFATGIGNGAGPLYLIFAIALAGFGMSLVTRRDLPSAALYAVVPSLAVAAADGGFSFYLVARTLQSESQFGRPHLHATVGTAAALVLALVGGATVLVVTAKLRALVTARREPIVAVMAVICAASLGIALVLNRYRVDRQRFGGLFFGIGSGAHGLDFAVILAHGVIVLVAVSGGVLIAGTLGRTRDASALLIGCAFGALFIDSHWIRSVGPYFRYLPAFALLISAAACCALLAGWCWVAQPRGGTR